MEDRLIKLCKDVKKMVMAHDYKTCQHEILKVMGEYPDSAIPHNLYGILLEKQNHYQLAMKHFRAAYALDPTYIPARYNMEQCVDWNRKFIREAYCEEDCVDICLDAHDTQFRVEYDEHHVGHMVHI